MGHAQPPFTNTVRWTCLLQIQDRCPAWNCLVSCTSFMHGRAARSANSREPAALASNRAAWLLGPRPAQNYTAVAPSKRNKAACDDCVQGMRNVKECGGVKTWDPTSPVTCTVHRLPCPVHTVQLRQL